MAIAFDAASNKEQDASTTATWAHTCTGANRYLSVGVACGAGKTISGATYNGVAMTLINSQVSGGLTFDRVYLFGLAAPASGANNIVVTASASTFIYCGAASYTGVDQTTPSDVNNAAGTLGNSYSVAATTTVDNDWLIGFTANGNTDPGGDANFFTGGANTTTRGTGNGWVKSMDSNGAKSPAGSYTLNMNAASSCLLSMNIAGISPSGGSGGGIVSTDRTIQQYLNTKAGTTGLTKQEAINRLAGTTGLTQQEAWNVYASLTPKTGQTTQQAANVKAGRTGLSVQQASSII